MKNILIIAPHADDEVLGCGATIAKSVQNGDQVYVAIMTNAHLGAPEICSEEMINIVRQEALNSHKYLGVKETVFFDFPAPQLDAYPSYKIADAIRILLHKHNINTLYIPFKGDSHKDHEVVFTASLVAARPISNYSVKEIYAYETLSETEWGAPFSGDVFIPTLFNDVSDFMERKMHAMSFYASQLNIAPHPRSIDIIKALAKLRGSTVGCKFAESFMQIRRILD